MDLRDRYYNIRVKEGDKQKIAFRMQYRLYKFRVMPIGLTNTLAIFQRHMNHVIQDYLDKFLIVYIDNILIYSNTLKEHIQQVRKALQRLQEFNLQVKLEKCKFHKKEVEFLGHIVSREGIQINPKKVEVVVNQPTPKTKQDVQSFIGFANYY